MKLSIEKLLRILLIGCLIGSLSCNDVTLDQVEKANVVPQTNDFEQQKGRMQPTENNVYNFTCCDDKKTSIFDSGCFPTRNRQTYESDKSFIVKAVANGEVLRVRNSTLGIVIIKHGAYMTVYSNIDKILVKEGDKVFGGRNIAASRKDYSEKRSELWFEIYFGTEKINPTEWVQN
jgi:hypothetical protein